MGYYKTIIDGYIAGVGRSPTELTSNITEAQYNAILEVIHNKPQPTNTTDYRLKTDLTWEEYERPPMPEPQDEPAVEDKAEAYDILMGVSE